MIRFAVSIVEGNVDGWDVHFPGLPVQHTESAVAALASAQAQARGLNQPSIMSITWEPRTPIGRQVVKVVTE